MTETNLEPDFNPQMRFNKRDTLAIVALSIAFLGMLWAALPFAMPTEEKKEVGEVVVDIAVSMIQAAKGTNAAEAPPPTKTFLDKVVENTFMGSLAVAAASFVLAIVMYIMGAKGRLFTATMTINIVTVALNLFLVAVAIALIFAAIRFIESVGLDFFS